MYKRRLQKFLRAAGFPVLEYGPDHFAVTPQIIGALRELEYLDQWRRAVDERWFHVRLEDHSLFLYSDVPGAATYSFLHSPILVETWREFLTARGFDYSRRNREEHAEAYQIALETAALRKHICPIRFDQDPVGYRAGIHPLAHVHVGLDNQVRLGVRRQLSVESFTLFVMRHMYPACWERLLDGMDNSNLERVVRASLQAVPDDCWTSRDQVELHLA